MGRNKKRGMQEQMRFAAAALFLLIFLPLLGTIFLSGKDAIKIKQEEELEQLLAPIVCREIPDDCKEQVICAQAVLVRSRVWLRCQEAEDPRTVYREILSANRNYKEKYGMNKEKLNRCREAVQKTENCVLCYGGQIVEGPFCRASNGWTRTGKEVLDKEDYGWIVGVESQADLDYDVERKPLEYTADELYEKLKETVKDQDIVLKREGILDQISVTETDSSGYVTEIQVGEGRLSGEAFRKALELPSASFTCEKKEEKLVFACRGEGHGFGMSQFGAEKMEDAGKSWREILNYYFPNAQVMRIKNK